MILCCRVPDAPVAALLLKHQADLANLGRRPIVVGGLRGEPRPVRAASAEARAFGVVPGMPLRQAERICPQARFFPDDREAEAELGRQLLAGLWALLPEVELDAPRVLAWARLSPRAAVWEPGPGVAGTVARSGGDTGIAAALEDARRIGDHLARRLRTALLLGVGSDKLLAELVAEEGRDGMVGFVPAGAERAFIAGHATAPDPGPFRPWSAPEQLEERSRLDPPVAGLEPLQFLVRGLVERLTIRLERAGAAATSVGLWLERLPEAGRPPAPYDALRHVVTPLARADALWKVVDEMLWRQEARGAVAAVRVSAGGLVPVGTRQIDLIARRDRRLAEAADHLREGWKP